MTPAVRRDGMKFIRNIWKVVSCKLQGKRMDGCDRVSRPMEHGTIPRARTGGQRYGLVPVTFHATSGTGAFTAKLCILRLARIAEWPKKGSCVPRSASFFICAFSITELENAISMGHMIKQIHNAVNAGCKGEN